MNVLNCHGFFPVDTEHFGPDRISVEFFFALSGFLFYHLLAHLREMKMGEAIRFVLRVKMKPLLVPTLIGMASNGVLNVLSGHQPVIEVFRFLWYIPAMMAILVVYTILCVWLKNHEKVFWSVVASLFIVATLLRFSGNEKLFFFDYIRSTSAVSLGLLVATVPKWNVKKQGILWALLVPVVAVIFWLVYHQFAKENMGVEALLDLVLYPILIYLSFQIDFHFPLFDLLGAWSFGIYAYQCPARLMVYLGVANRWIPFGLILVLTLTDYAIRILIGKAREAKKNA